MVMYNLCMCSVQASAVLAFCRSVLGASLKCRLLSATIFPHALFPTGNLCNIGIHCKPISSREFCHKMNPLFSYL